MSAGGTIQIVIMAKPKFVSPSGLGSLDGEPTEAHAINDVGEIVGFSGDWSESAAILWTRKRQRVGIA